MSSLVLLTLLHLVPIWRWGHADDYINSATKHETDRRPPLTSHGPYLPVCGLSTINKRHTSWFGERAYMWYQLTTDRKECVGLLSLRRSHTFQSTKPSPADVHPTLHLRLPKHGTEQCDGDDVVLLLGGIYLLGTPEGRRLHMVDKTLMGSPSFS